MSIHQLFHVFVRLDLVEGALEQDAAALHDDDVVDEVQEVDGVGDEDPRAAMCARIKGVAFQRKREGECEAN